MAAGREGTRISEGGTAPRLAVSRGVGRRGGGGLRGGFVYTIVLASIIGLGMAASSSSSTPPVHGSSGRMGAAGTAAPAQDAGEGGGGDEATHVMGMRMPSALPASLATFMSQSGVEDGIYQGADDIDRHIRINPRRPIAIEELAKELELTPRPVISRPNILKPSTLDPRPSTLDPKPSTLNPRPSTLDPPPDNLAPIASLHAELDQDRVDRCLQEGESLRHRSRLCCCCPRTRSSAWSNL